MYFLIIINQLFGKVVSYLSMDIWDGWGMDYDYGLVIKVVRVLVDINVCILFLLESKIVII